MQSVKCDLSDAWPHLWKGRIPCLSIVVDEQVGAATSKTSWVNLLESIVSPVGKLTAYRVLYQVDFAQRRLENPFWKPQVGTFQNCEPAFVASRSCGIGVVKIGAEVLAGANELIEEMYRLANRQRQLSIPLIIGEKCVDIQTTLDLLIESPNIDRIDYAMHPFLIELVNIVTDSETAVLVPYQDRNYRQRIDVFSTSSKLHCIQETLMR